MIVQFSGHRRHIAQGSTRTDDEVVLSRRNVGYDNVDLAIGDVEALCKWVVNVEVQAIARVVTEDNSSNLVGNLAVGREIRCIPAQKAVSANANREKEQILPSYRLC